MYRFPALNISSSTTKNAELSCEDLGNLTTLCIQIWRCVCEAYFSCPVHALGKTTCWWFGKGCNAIAWLIKASLFRIFCFWMITEDNDYCCCFLFISDSDNRHRNLWIFLLSGNYWKLLILRIVQKRKITTWWLTICRLVVFVKTSHLQKCLCFNQVALSSSGQCPSSGNIALKKTSATWLKRRRKIVIIPFAGLR